MRNRQAHWNERRVLVTGATGFLGGWLVKALLERRAHVIALARDGAPRSLFAREAMASRVEVVSGSVTDRELLRRVISEYDVQTVFHLAAQANGGVAQNDPLGTLNINVAGVWNLLEAVRQSHVREVVVASSNKAYGTAFTLPYAETHPMNGVFPLDVSKSCADLICRMYAVTYGVPVCITRCANLFGGGDLSFNRVIPGVIRSTQRGERFVVRSNGSFTRDFLYVRDAVRAHIMLAEAMAANSSLRGEAFNFGLEMRVSVLQLVEQVLGIMRRRDLAPIIQDLAADEVREQQLSTEKARRILGWTPEYTLEQGLRETIDWYDHVAESQPRRVSAPALDEFNIPSGDTRH